MSRSKSQSQSNLDEIERTTTAKSFYSELNRDWETQSVISTRTHDSYKAAFFNFLRDFKQKYKTKNYQYVMRRGARRWHAMTQADRAPYILEAARNRRTAKSRMSTREIHSDKKKQDTNTKEYRNQRCPACGRRKISRERSRSSSNSLISSQSGSSKSSNSRNRRKLE